MKIEELVANPTLRLKKSEIANIIGINPENIQTLLGLSFSRKMPLCWRAAWILDHMAEKEPELLLKHIDFIWTELGNHHPDGVTRSLLRLLTRYSIPEDQIGKSTDICLEWIEKKNIPVAIKVYAIEILLKVARSYPDLSHEFITIISDQIILNSLGYEARAKKVIKKLQAIEEKEHYEIN